MANEVATTKQIPAPKAPLIATRGRGVGAIIPQDVEQVFRLAGAIAAANMAPKAYNRSVEAITVGILHGMEVGLTPMAALQSIAVINGMPTIWGDGALGLVRGSGLLEDFDERIEGEGDQMSGVCICRRRGQTSEIRREFTVTDAKKAKLWGKSGPWSDYPKRMLQMRARSWALRDGFADVLRGLAVAEEVRDMGPLTEAADGTLMPASKPLRAHYAEQAEKHREGPEGATTGAAPTGEDEDHYALTNWDGEVSGFRFAGLFTDAFAKAIKAAPDVGALQGLFETNKAALDRLSKDGEQGPDWREELTVAAGKRYAELTAAPREGNAPAQGGTGV